MRPFAALVLAGLVMVIISVVPRDATASAAGLLGPGQPVAPEEMLMLWHDRAYGQLKLAILKKKAQRGVEQAWLLAELANANQGHNNDPRYKAFAASLSKLAADAAGALQDEKFDPAKDLLRQMDQQCTACHDQFRNDDDAKTQQGD